MASLCASPEDHRGIEAPLILLKYTRVQPGDAGGGEGRRDPKILEWRRPRNNHFASSPEQLAIPKEPLLQEKELRWQLAIIKPLQKCS